MPLMNYGGDDPRLQQLLAAALAQTGGQGSAPTWQHAADSAPRQGGMGGTPPMDSMMMQRGSTPPPGSDSPSFPEEQYQTNTPTFPGGRTPHDASPQDQTPRVLDRIPDQPPIDQTGVATPISSNPDMWGGQFKPIDVPFGFGMNGGLFGGG